MGKLSISYLSNLEYLSFGSYSFCNLSHLIIRNNNNLKTIVFNSAYDPLHNINNYSFKALQSLTISSIIYLSTVIFLDLMSLNKLIIKDGALMFCKDVIIDSILY